MEFANPLFLYGLAAIAIPIIIHLFNFRKFQKVYFTNVKFIEELQQQTQKQSQLKHLLILFARIFAISALVIAFAQPYIPVSKASADQEVHNAISIYVDNSFSMQAASAEGSQLDEALNKAREIALAYKSSDKFQLLTNDFEGRHQRFVSREDFFEMLDETEISPVTRYISDVFKRQSEMLHNNDGGSKTAFLISDFQEGISDFGNISADSSISAYLLPLEARSTDNLFIDSVWFDAPVYRVNQLANLSVRIVNASTENYEKIPVKLMINGTQKAIASFDLKAGSEVDVKLPFTNSASGMHYGELEITDFPITYDDKFYFTYNVKEEIPVLAINATDENPFLNSLFGNDSTFVFENVAENRLDYTSLHLNNLIILNGLNIISSGLSQELKRLTEGGGSIVVFPGTMADLDSYHEFFLNMKTPGLAALDTFPTRINKINVQSRLFDDVFESLPENIDLPVVQKHYPIQRSTSSMMEVLLEMQNGEVFLGSEAIGQGMFYLFTTPLDPAWTNLPKHAIFVPTLYKIALLSQPSIHLYFITGRNENIPLKNREAGGDQVYKIKKVDGDFEIIPEARSVGSQVNIFTGNQIKEAGNYNINYDGKVASAITFNYDRLESDLKSLTKTDLQTEIADAGLSHFTVLKDPQNSSLTTMISEINSGLRLWKIFILAALAFLLAEVILLRLWK